MPDVKVLAPQKSVRSGSRRSFGKDYERNNETEWPNNTQHSLTLPVRGQGEGVRGR